MRIDVEKYVFIGPIEQKELFFRRAQEIGAIEFINQTKTTQPEIPEVAQRISLALKVLRSQPLIPQEEYSNLDEADHIREEVLSSQEELEMLYEKNRILNQEISRIIPFGDFSLDDIKFIEDIGKKKLRFFFSKKAQEVHINDHPELIYIGAEHDLDYYLAIGDHSSNSSSYENMVEMFFESSLSELYVRKSETENEIHEREEYLKKLACYRDLLKELLVSKLNIHNLKINKDFISEQIDGMLFAIEGWVAKSKISKVQKLIKKFSVHFEKVEVEKTDKIPTHLENSGLARIGEDLVRIYDTPSTTDKDPSSWVFWAFTLFFSIIVGDGGYGAIFLILALFLRYKFPNVPDMGKRFLKLVIVLGLSCFVWGLLSSSFFGIDFSLDANIRKYAPLTWVVEKKLEYHLQIKDDVYQGWVKKFPQLEYVKMPYSFLSSAFVMKGSHKVYILFDKFVNNIMLEFALLVGVLHVILGLLRNIIKSWAGFGWMLFLIGGYLYFPKLLNATTFLHFVFGFDKTLLSNIGVQVLYAGIIIACVLSIIQNKLKGLGEIVRLIEVFADVLSYLRLYALALAGSIMASTFNGLGEEIGILIGVIVILVGHTINIALSVMGGIIHGLRLNFLEWYHYCFEGGGKLYKPLALLKIK